MGTTEKERLPEGDRVFFDFKANTSTGNTLNFERFEGYWTMIVHGALTCSPGIGLEEGLKYFEHLHSVWPFVLEVLVFPFRHPRVDYEKADCLKGMTAIKKKGRKIHLMDEVKVNGEETHPIHQFLKKPFKIDELETDVATYFFVNPDGEWVVAHHGANKIIYTDGFRRNLRKSYSF